MNILDYINYPKYPRYTKIIIPIAICVLIFANYRNGFDAFIAFLFGAYGVYNTKRTAYQCPNCHRWNGGQETGREVVGGGSSTVEWKEKEYDASRDTVIERDRSSVFNESTYQVGLKCKECNHQWSMEHSETKKDYFNSK